MEILEYRPITRFEDQYIADERQILALEMGWLRKILGVCKLQKLRNEDIWTSLSHEETLGKRIQ